ncbi:arp2/3 complex-activating protein rickA-like isoform X2 [Salvia hispanica]|uniref:arp2/3 complex-activating protein rickA-like isoform X2 n=1 Tax=Salvia hispanica TaxID=49212 RepID=UPI00200964E9|nr:arp2/3 complex-activating protein rickA-like isoform X2 [Salvia hispanica]
MKKKIVINVPMHSEKAKSKAMKIAVAVEEIISVGEAKPPPPKPPVPPVCPPPPYCPPICCESVYDPPPSICSIM